MHNRKLRGWCLMLVTIVLMSSTVTAATTRTVGLGGASPNYATIALALAAASDGDTIQIVTNVQTECGIVINNSVTITGNGTNTILQGATTRSNATDRIFKMNNAAKAATIQNMTIQYGYVFASSTPYCGGALYNYAGTVIVQNCVIQMNDANENMAGYGGAIVQLNTAANALVLSNCVVANNSIGPSTVACAGGALYLGEGSLLIDSCYFAGNTAIGGGGAIKVAGSSRQCLIQTNPLNWWLTNFRQSVSHISSE